MQPSMHACDLCCRQQLDGLLDGQLDGQLDGRDPMTSHLLCSNVASSPADHVVITTHQQNH